MELTECPAPKDPAVGGAKDTGEPTDIEHLECTSLDSAEHQFATSGTKPIGGLNQRVDPCGVDESDAAQIHDDARDNTGSVNEFDERRPQKWTGCHIQLAPDCDHHPVLNERRVHRQCWSQRHEPVLALRRTRSTPRPCGLKGGETLMLDGHLYRRQRRLNSAVATWCRGAAPFRAVVRAPPQSSRTAQGPCPRQRARAVVAANWQGSIFRESLVRSPGDERARPGHGDGSRGQPRDRAWQRSGSCESLPCGASRRAAERSDHWSSPQPQAREPAAPESSNGSWLATPADLPVTRQQNLRLLPDGVDDRGVTVVVRPGRRMSGRRHRCPPPQRRAGEPPGRRLVAEGTPQGSLARSSADRSVSP